MFHYRDGAATYGLKNNGMILYKEADNNPLLNDFDCYILDSLHKVQNMQEYALPPVCDTDHVDIDKYVSHAKTSMELVITAPAGANAAAAVGEVAAQSSATTTPATPAAGSPRAAAGVTPR